MIGPLTTWEQVCAVLSGPDLPGSGLETETLTAQLTGTQLASAQLPQEDFEAAFSILEAAIQEAALQKAPVLDRAQLHLYLASLHSLYGDAASDEAQATLGRAALLAPAIRQTPLYLALSAELDARLRGPEATYPDVQAIHGDPLSRFHAVSALALADRSQEALGVHVTVQELPPHLGWRLRSWQADCEEMQGNTEAALHLYAEAARLSRGSYRAGMLQEQAALYLQLGQPTEAAAVLERARAEYPPLPENLGSIDPDSTDPDGIEQAGQVLGLASWYYLMSQAALNQDQHDAALENIQEADRLERLMGDPSYGVALVYGQVLVAQGRQQEALRHFDAALMMAQPEDRPYALHELGVAFLDLDRPLEARERLESAAGTPDYPFVPEVLADIAEAEYRLGRLPEAQGTAELALAQGAVVPASLVLGSVEMDYYHLDEALEHYLRVVREAAPGTRDWVTAEQMAADIMAQQGFPDPTSAYLHAQQALEYTDPSDDWYGTLQDHLTRAETLMGSGKGRTLN